MFVLQVLIALVAPVWLVPLFYRLTPLGHGELRQRLLRLAAAARVPVVGVWVVDQSRKSRTANAAVVGLVGTRRILLFDTLLSEFTPEEVEVVLAHELAHHVHRDVWRGLLVHAVLGLATLWAADRTLRAGIAILGLSTPADLAGLPLLGLILLGIGGCRFRWATGGPAGLSGRPTILPCAWWHARPPSSMQWSDWRP
jgi:STE24 endopeptidase